MMITGEPIVKLMGLKCDIDVRCEQIGPGRYQCCYTPELPGEKHAPACLHEKQSSHQNVTLHGVF
jgi:hypothetical protein